MVKDSKLQKIRFLTVGIANTLIDFGLLFILESFSVTPIVANFFSTSVAFSFSYTANRRFTFKSRSLDIKREIGLFIAVTLFGLWVIQTFIIYVAFLLLSGSNLSNNATLFLAKLTATGASLLWNYLLYSRIVFSSSNADNRHEDE